MNLLADENIDSRIVARLRNDGHDTVWIVVSSPGVSDEEVLQLASNSNAILLTEDKDFGELVYRRRLNHSGVILLRLAGLDNDQKAEVVSQFLMYQSSDLIGAFAVIMPNAVRIRKPTGNA